MLGVGAMLEVGAISCPGWTGIIFRLQTSCLCLSDTDKRVGYLSLSIIQDSFRLWDCAPVLSHQGVAAISRILESIWRRQACPPGPPPPPPFTREVWNSSRVRDVELKIGKEPPPLITLFLSLGFDCACVRVLGVLAIPCVCLCAVYYGCNSFPSERDRTKLNR